MTWASIATQFVLTVGASLAERLASALSARIKQEPETANPVDVAIATKSAVAADREGKIASERAKVLRQVCQRCGILEHPVALLGGLCPACVRNEERLKERRLGDYGRGG